MPVMPAPTTSTSTSATREVMRPSPASRRRLYRSVYYALRSAHAERKGRRVVSVDQKASAVPHAVDPALPDRIPAERYFDPDFYRLEVERLWPRVWQMACRLEEIPQQHDFVEYEFLDQSVVVLRTEDMGVRAFENACR